MAGSNSLFRIVKAVTGGALSGLSGVVDGVTAVGTNIAALAAVFKDSSGNAVLPQLNTLGQIPVTFDSGDCVHATGLLAGTDTQAEITGAAITLVDGQFYRKIAVTISAMSESCFELVWVDDEGGAPTITVLWRGQVGPGQFTVCCSHACLEFEVTGSGTRRLYVRGQNADANQLTEMQATISAETATLPS